MDQGCKIFGPGTAAGTCDSDLVLPAGPGGLAVIENYVRVSVFQRRTAEPQAVYQRLTELLQSSSLIPFSDCLIELRLGYRTGTSSTASGQLSALGIQ